MYLFLSFYFDVYFKIEKNVYNPYSNLIFKKSHSVFGSKPAAWLLQLSFQSVNDPCINIFEEIPSAIKGV